jgi:hypothetical protein
MKMIVIEKSQNNRCACEHWRSERALDAVSE